MFIKTIPLILMLTAPLYGEPMTCVGTKYVAHDHVGVVFPEATSKVISLPKIKANHTRPSNIVAIQEHVQPVASLDFGIAYAIGGPFVLNHNETVPFNTSTNDNFAINTQINFPFPAVTIGKTGTYLVRYMVTVQGQPLSPTAEFALVSASLGQIPGSDRARPVEAGQQVELCGEVVISLNAGDELSLVNICENPATLGSCSSMEAPTLATIYLQQLN